MPHLPSESALAACGCLSRTGPLETSAWVPCVGAMPLAVLAWSLWLVRVASRYLRSWLCSSFYDAEVQFPGH